MVDTAILNRLLLNIDGYCQDLQAVHDMKLEDFVVDIKSQRFVERTLHIAIECCLDICHHIISDRKWREPSSYADAFMVLAEHGVLPAGTLEQYRLMAQFRNKLVHYYENVDANQVFIIAKTRCGDFSAFTSAIRLWLGLAESQGD
jgi:uncharacterized protein YutE (UPF0331/DUF86 family)